MTNLTIGFDETVLAKAVVDQVVAAVENAINNAFHNVFPRLRREEIEDATHPLTMTTRQQAEAPLKDVSARCNGNIRPSAYLIKNIPENPINLSTVYAPEGFYFLKVDDKTGEASLISYHVLETNNA